MHQRGEYWKKLEEELKTKRLILLGETHGTDANIKAAFQFVSKLSPDILALELEPKWNKIIKKIEKDSPAEILNLFDKESWILQAGVMNLEHIKFIKEFLKNKKRTVTFFAVQNPNWNRTEKASAVILKKAARKGCVLAIMGSLHARKLPFIHKKTKMIPIGSRLQKEAVSVRIRYVKGKAFNFGEVILQDKKAASLFSKTDQGLIKSTSKYFDYDYIIKDLAMPLWRSRIKSKQNR